MLFLSRNQLLKLKMKKRAPYDKKHVYILKLLYC